MNQPADHASKNQTRFQEEPKSELNEIKLTSDYEINWFRQRTQLIRIGAVICIFCAAILILVVSIAGIFAPIPVQIAMIFGACLVFASTYRWPYSAAPAHLFLAIILLGTLVIAHVAPIPMNLILWWCLTLVFTGLVFDKWKEIFSWVAIHLSLAMYTLSIIPKNIILLDYVNDFLAILSIGLLMAYGTRRREHLLAEFRSTVEASQASNVLLSGIAEVEAHFIADEKKDLVYEHMLAALLRSTKSPYGFVGEIRSHNPQVLSVIATSDLSWDSKSQRMFSTRQQGGLEFNNEKSLIGEILSTGEPVISNDVKNDPRSNNFPKGHPKLSSFIGIPVYAGNNMVGVVGLAGDINGYQQESIRYLQPLLQSFGTIITGLAERESRQRVKESLEQSSRLEAVGQLTGGIAHDFNNLLAIILGNADLLTFEISDNAEALESLRMMQGAAQRGAVLVERLLSFSRKQPLSPVPCDLPSVILGIEEMLRRTLGESVSLETSFESNMWMTKIDQHQFENAVINLAINARDAMEHGGTLSVKIRNTEITSIDDSITEDDIPEGEYLHVAVSDTGMGMSPAVCQRAFEPFFTTKDIGEGSGLGLSMVYGFVRQSEGHVTIKSEEFKGTIVNLYIPRFREIVEAKPTEPIPSDENITLEKGVGRILVVEDEQDVRIIACRLLRHQEYDVVEAQNGREAISLLRTSGRFDLLFTDVILPGGVNGLKIAERAREMQPGIEVLYTTGYSDQIIVGDSEASVILKPYFQKDLLKIVSSLLPKIPSSEPIGH